MVLAPIRLSRSRSHAAFGYAACALAGGLWGTGFFFGKIAMREMRFRHTWCSTGFFSPVSGSAPFCCEDVPGWMHAVGASFLRLSSVARAVSAAFPACSPTVSHASLMVGTLPVVLAVGASIFAHERMDRVGWIALAVSSIGAAFIAFGHSTASARGDAPSMIGDLMIVVPLMISLVWILINEPAAAARPLSADCDSLWPDDRNGHAGRLGVRCRWAAADSHFAAGMAGVRPTSQVLLHPPARHCCGTGV